MRPKVPTFLAACVASLLSTSCGGSGGGGGGGCPEPGEALAALVGEGLTWHTEEVRERATAAAALGLGYDFEARQFVAPAALPSQILLRPGSQILPESIFPGWCTAAFVFGGRRQIATAGHCTREGDRVLAVVAPTTVFVIGTTSRSVDGGPGNDWALINIDPVWRPFVAPDAAFIGGPCGRAEPGGAVAPAVKFVGHAAAGSPRAGALLSFDDACLTCVGPSNIGDSGAPVLEAVPEAGDVSGLCAGGRALGILTHGEVLAGAVPTGVFLGTPISKIGAALDDGEIVP